jgi:hypothetical protein
MGQTFEKREYHHLALLALELTQAFIQPLALRMRRRQLLR